MIDNYVDWVEYWDQEINSTIDHLEDFEPTLINVTKDQIQSFLWDRDSEIIVLDCEIRSDGRILIMWSIGYGEDAVSLNFLINNDNIIEEVEYR